MYIALPTLVWATSKMGASRATMGQILRFLMACLAARAGTATPAAR